MPPSSTPASAKEGQAKLMMPAIDAANTSFFSIFLIISLIVMTSSISRSRPAIGAR